MEFGGSRFGPRSRRPIESGDIRLIIQGVGAKKLSDIGPLTPLEVELNLAAPYGRVIQTWNRKYGILVE